MRLNPQLNHDVTSAKNVTRATADFGVRGHDAIPRMTRCIGADEASTWPVMMINAICSVNGIRSQKPRPHASTMAGRDAGVAKRAAAATRNVAISAKMKA